MELEDLRLLLKIVSNNKDIDTQDKFRLENRLRLMIDYYSAKKSMIKAKTVFNAKSEMLKLD